MAGLSMHHTLYSRRRWNCAYMRGKAQACRACYFQPKNSQSMRLYDCHNHLQDPRLRPFWPEIWKAFDGVGLRALVVNGTEEKDWPTVSELARQSSRVIPAYGLHPWQVPGCSPSWRERLAEFWKTPRCVAGEIGLDRWREGLDPAQQEAAFLWQWREAVQRELPITVHCLKAWGRLLELLRMEDRAPSGFLLHSYGGPADMIEPFTQLGAYFSLSGYFAQSRKSEQRKVFKLIPDDRLLIETDAPDMPLPEERRVFRLAAPNSSKPLNHPANILAVYQFAAELFGESLQALTRRVEGNFLRLFGERTCLHPGQHP